MKQKSKQALAVLCVLASGCLWGSMGVFVRHLNAAGLSAMQIVEIRSIITAVLTLAGTALIRPQLLRIRLRDLWCFAGTGLCSVLFFNFCYFRAMEYMSLSAAAVLLYTTPVFVMLLSALLFREKLSWRKAGACALAVGGCVLVSGVAGGQTDWSVAGLLLGLGAGFGYALYSIFSRFAINRGYTAVTITVYTFLFAALGGIPLTDFGPVAQTLRTDGAAAVGFWLLYAVLTTVLPYLLYTYGLHGVENSAASVIASIEPVVATLLGLMFFAEWPTPAAVAGMGLVLAAVCLLSLHRRGRT